MEEEAGISNSDTLKNKETLKQDQTNSDFMFPNRKFGLTDGDFLPLSILLVSTMY